MPKIVRRISICRDVWELVSDDGAVLRPIVLEHPIRRLKPEDYQKAYERSKANWIQLEGQLAKELKDAEIQGIDWEAQMLAQLEAAEAEQQAQQVTAPILGIMPQENDDQGEDSLDRDGTTEVPFGVGELETVEQPVMIETQEIRRRGPGRPRKDEVLVN